MHGHNKSFASDPFAYCQRYAINHLSMKVHGEKDRHDFDGEVLTYDNLGRVIPGPSSAYFQQVGQAKRSIELAGHGQFDLEPVTLEGRTVIYLRFVVPGQFAPKVEYGGLERGSDAPLSAYWLGYEFPGIQGAGKARIPYVDLPKTNPAHRLMLTGAMNGCSMVITEHPNDPTKLRVYHDSVHGIDTFKDDIVYGRIDYIDEGYASANKRAPLLRALNAPVTRTRSGSVGDKSGVQPLAPIPCVRTSYGDLAQYRAVESGSGSTIPGTAVQVRTSLNFLYFDATVNKWTAVSQALETQKTTSQPAKAWYESSDTFKRRQKAYDRRGVQVAMVPSTPPWRATLPY